jgi:hypothetical protein
MAASHFPAQNAGLFVMHYTSSGVHHTNSMGLLWDKNPILQQARWNYTSLSEVLLVWWSEFVCWRNPFIYFSHSVSGLGMTKSTYDDEAGIFCVCCSAHLQHGSSDPSNGTEAPFSSDRVRPCVGMFKVRPQQPWMQRSEPEASAICATCSSKKQ